MRKDASVGLTSIVILTFNELEYTKRCVESIRRHTPEPHEIVFVDNGSKDGTPRWLRALAREEPRCRLIENPTNLGFARGCNQGIAASTGEWIVLLNNDTIVTEHWLSGMRECHEHAPRAGIVGPMTNEISGPQMVERVDVESAGGLEAYARQWRERHRHRRTLARRVVGFCMLFRRALIDEIGPLDDSFGTGNFEDDDLCRRALLAGYQNAIAGDVFIHHAGSRSFIGNRMNYGAAMSGNRRIFEDKWRRLAEADDGGRRVLMLEALERAEQQHHSERLQLAIDLCLEAIRVVPRDPEPYLALARMLFEVGSHAQSLEVLERLPGGIAAPEARILAGFVHEGLDQLDRAHELAEEARDEPETRARALTLEGLIAWKRLDHERAAACFEAAIALDPTDGEPWVHLGTLRWNQAPDESALGLLERGFILSPTAPGTASAYHSAAKQLGCEPRAVRIFREARALHPFHRGIAFLLIDLLIAGEEHAEAMAETEKALELFEVDDGFLRAALAIRARVGPRERAAGSRRAGSIALCAIVRDEELHLVRCLRTVAPLVDEMIVVDTGSSDRSRELAIALGAKVFDCDWKDDFSLARNQACERADSDWILVLDADEVIAPADFDAIRAMTARGRKPAVDGYALTTRNYTTTVSIAGWTENDGAYPAEQAGSGWYPSRKVRLFRNDRRIRFEGAVHEMVENSIARNGMKIADVEVPVHHYGPLDLERTGAKAEFYYRLGKKKLAESASEPGRIYELAVQAGDLAKYDEALELWDRYLRLGVTENLALAHMNLGHVHLETDRWSESIEASRRALALDPELKEAAFNLAIAELCLGRLDAAVRGLDQLLARGTDYPPALALMAGLCRLTGDSERFAACLERLKERDSNPAGFLHACATRLHRAGRDADADKLLEATRQIWKDLLAGRGLDASDEHIEKLMVLASEERPPAPVAY